VTFRSLAKVLVAAAALFALAGCEMLGSGQGSLVIGNIYLNGTIAGGTPFTVVFYDEATRLDAATEYETAPRAAVIEGVFPGGTNDEFDIANFQAEGIPAGQYTVMAWIDGNGDGIFTPLDPDYEDFGFYSGGYLSSPQVQPPPNVVVPEKGVLDIDIWVGPPPA
jgi:hypothetical protein